MQIKKYPGAKEFADACLPFLLEHEAENNLMIGILLHLIDGKPGWSNVPPEFYSVKDNGAVVCAALRTPPHNIIIAFASPLHAVEALADYACRNRLDLPGVLSENNIAAAFRNCYAEPCGKYAERKFSLRIYKLTKVNAPSDVSGSWHIAGEEDLPQVFESHKAFSGEVGTSAESVERIARDVKDGRYLIWNDGGQPVCVVGSGGPVPHGIRVAPVYTPPEFRRKGYATAATAAMSEHLLKSGFSFCVLFTDLANPTSNSIYQKIGYRPVCDFTDFRFIPIGD